MLRDRISPSGNLIKWNFKGYIAVHVDVIAMGNQWIVDKQKCIGCGDCVILCPVKALKMQKQKPVMVDQNSCCRESCRICEAQCQKYAITAY